MSSVRRSPTLKSAAGQLGVRRQDAVDANRSRSQGGNQPPREPGPNQPGNRTSRFSPIRLEAFPSSLGSASRDAVRRRERPVCQPDSAVGVAMPSDRQPARTGDDDDGRASFPALADDNRCGHDPGRWLDRPLLDGDTGTSSPIEQAFAIIRGLPTKAECRAWRAVERRLDRGPRDQVIDAIEQRLAELDERGGRPALGPERRGDVRDVEIDGDHEISFSASRRTDGEAEKLGTGRIAQTPMSGSPPGNWTLPDGMEPVAPEPTDGDDQDTDQTDSQTNTLAAALGGDGQ